MSDALIATLQEQIARLQQENATIRAEAKDRRLKAKALREENEKYAAALTELADERDRYKSTLETQPSELLSQLDQYKGKLRDRDHRDKFRDLARKAGVRDAALDDLYSLSGYKAEADEPDESRITAAIATALEGRDWLRAAKAEESANGRAAGSATKPAPAAAHETRNPGPGANRGGASGKDDPDSALASKYPNAYRVA